MLTMEEALKGSPVGFKPGEIVKGRIIEVRPKEVLVDIGYKSEGAISGNEFDDIKACKVGDEIDVLIEKLEDKDGMVVLSKEKDRKSTRLNSSHSQISYAVFCLKKKKTKKKKDK